MLTLVISQIALAAAIFTAPSASAIVPASTSAAAALAGPDDKTVLDILNDTRPDILGRGASHHCPPVTSVYVNGRRRLAPTVDHGFSRATFYFAGDTVMMMLPHSIADALRTVPAKAVRDIRYMDCRADVSGGGERNTLWIVTK
jgi:hypothetical protein